MLTQSTVYIHHSLRTVSVEARKNKGREHNLFERNRSCKVKSRPNFIDKNITTSEPYWCTQFFFTQLRNFLRADWLTFIINKSTDTSNFNLCESQSINIEDLPGFNPFDFSFGDVY